MRISLCLNCLVKGGDSGDDSIREVPVGMEKGSQRDPYQDTVSLCQPCAQALVTGDFATLNSRYQAEITVRRET